MKRPFRFGVVLRRIREYLQRNSLADAAMFEQLVACVISIRTYDETLLPLALKLFERAPTPAAVAALCVALDLSAIRIV